MVHILVGMCTVMGEGMKYLSYEVPQWYDIEELFRYMDISVSLVVCLLCRWVIIVLILSSFVNCMLLSFIIYLMLWYFKILFEVYKCAYESYNYDFNPISINTVYLVTDDAETYLSCSVSFAHRTQFIQIQSYLWQLT